MTAPLITNERGQLEWEWIVGKVGLDAAHNAIQALSGSQRPYPLNIARKLGLKLPERLSEPAAAPRAVAHAHLATLKASLNHERDKRNHKCD